MALIKKMKRLASIPKNFDGDASEIYVMDYLLQAIPSLNIDEDGNLYLINPGTPLVCAHMDTCQTKDEESKIVKGSVSIQTMEVTRWLGNKQSKILEKVMSAPYQVGFDDKAGIAIAMQLYEELGNSISLLFTVQEEVGGKGAKAFLKNHGDLLEKCTYCIIPDRRNGYDLIGHGNQYCSKEFEDKVMKYIGVFGYKPEHGARCDANTFREKLNCINVSCGYYNPHTKDDFLSIDEFENAYEAIRDLVMRFNERLPIYKLIGYKEHSKKNKQQALPFNKSNDRYHDYNNDEYEDYDSKQKDKEKGKGWTLSEIEKETIKLCDKILKVNKVDSTIQFFVDTKFLTTNFDTEVTIPKGKYYFYTEESKI